MKSTRGSTPADALPVPGQASVSPVQSNCDLLAGRAEVERGISSRRKRLVLEWWKATLAGNRLIPARGCMRVAEEIKTGERTESRESHRNLTANIGDRFLVCGPSLDQIAILHVRSIRVDGWNATFFISLSTGAVNDGVVSLLRLA